MKNHARQNVSFISIIILLGLFFGQYVHEYRRTHKPLTAGQTRIINRFFDKSLLAICPISADSFIPVAGIEAQLVMSYDNVQNVHQPPDAKLSINVDNGQSRILVPFFQRAQPNSNEGQDIYMQQKAILDSGKPFKVNGWLSYGSYHCTPGFRDSYFLLIENNSLKHAVNPSKQYLTNQLFRKSI